MGLKVRYLSGPDAGKVLDFDDSKEEIGFGRGMSADVHFPDDLTVVSREHFGLRKEYGGYKFVINPEKPVFMGGRPLYDDQALPKDAEIQLGSPTGPKLKLERYEGRGSNQVETEILRPQREMAQDLRTTQSRGNRTASVVGIVALLLLVLAAGGYFISQALRKDVTTAQGDITTAQHDITTVQQQMTAMQTDVPAVRAEIAKLAETNVDAAAIIAKNKESVYLVRQFDAKGEEASTATASVVLMPDGTKALATNSHVTEMFDELKTDPRLKGGKVVVVQSKGPEYTTLKVVSAVHHPGFDMFLKWLEGYPKRVIVGAADLMRFAAPGWDVGLLFVDDPSKLGPPLTMASRETILALRAGDPLVSIGFPGESLAGTDHRSPDPTSQTGRVVAMTTFFLRVGKPEENQLVQESVPAAGGASGSPVFNSKGEVVAFVNAGNTAGKVNGERIPNGALVNYAQRADTMLDLMSGKVDDQIPVIKAMTEDEDKQLSMTPEQQLARIDRILAEIAGGQQNVKKVGELGGPMATAVPELGSPKNYVQQVNLASQGLYVFVLQSADGRPLHGVIQAGNKRSDSPSNGAITFVGVNQATPGPATLIVADINAVEAQKTPGGNGPPPPTPAPGAPPPAAGTPAQLPAAPPTPDAPATPAAAPAADGSVKVTVYELPYQNDAGN